MNKNKTYNIRLATLDDAEAIAQVHICSWQKMYQEFIPETILDNLSLETRTQEWSALIKQAVNVLVIEMENQLVGFASICAFRDANNTERFMGEISAIYLHPNFWRKGLGAQLCKAALSELTKLGYQEVGLWVLEANAQARSFYEALGFEATGATKLEEFYEGGALLEEMLYKKAL